MERLSAEVQRWMDLSLATVRARRMQAATAVNAMLQQAAADSTMRRLEPALLLWAAENFVHAADFVAAVDACSRLRQRFGGTEWGDDSFLIQAQAYLRLEDIDASLRTYEEAARGTSEAARTARLEHGMLLERVGRHDEAIVSLRELLTRNSSEPVRSWIDRIEDVAERFIRRCTHSRKGAASPCDVAFELARALRERDFGALQRLASPTHFGVGASEFSYLGFDAIADGLRDALARSNVLSDPLRLDRTGGSVSLVTTGWSDPVPIKRILFQITEEPSGWEWTGVTPSGVGFMPKLGPGDPDPRPRPGPPGPRVVNLQAPWENGECLRAGGLNRFAESFIPIVGWFIMLADSASDCGYGAYGYYYGQGDHNGVNYNAIDFTGYFRFGPYVSKVPVMPALAAHDGVVTNLWGDTPYGVKTRNNLVELDHLWPEQLQYFLNAPGSTPEQKLMNGLPTGPGGQGGETRTRYLHLSPGLYVSKGMFIPQGTALGYMDDTGHSGIPHLHFSVHLRDFIVGGYAYNSVPVTFNGRSLGPDNDGDCVCSVNQGPPMNVPTVQITGPSDFSSYPPGSLIMFTGTGSDPSDGPLMGASLTWSSDVDGMLGQGTQISVTLSGTAGFETLHHVTLTGVNRAGNMAANTISVYVGSIS